MSVHKIKFLRKIQSVLFIFFSGIKFLLSRNVFILVIAMHFSLVTCTRFQLYT